jgi:hypothetical protein
MIHVYSNLIDTSLETLIERIAALPVDRMFINNPYTPVDKLRAALAVLPAGRTFRNHFNTPHHTLHEALSALPMNTYFLNCPFTSPLVLGQALSALPVGAMFTNHPNTPIETLVTALGALAPNRIFINHPKASVDYLRAALAALPGGTCFINHHLTPEATVSHALSALAPNVEHRNINITQLTPNPASTLSSSLHSSERKRKQSEISTSSAANQVTLSSQTIFSPTSHAQSNQIEEQTDLELCKKPKS